VANLEARQQRFRLATLKAEHFKNAVQLIKALGGGFNENMPDTQTISHAH
jgi:outer membrane protein TolC